MKHSRASRLRHFTIPTILATLIPALYAPPAQAVEHHRGLAEWAGCDRFQICYDAHGLFVGFGAMKMARGGGLPSYFLTIAANTYNYNVGNAAAALGYDNTKPARVWVTVNSGVYVGNQDVQSGSVSMLWQTFPAGSECRLINNGFIYGRGGAGGNAPSGAGEDGQRAVVLSNIPSGISIDNTNGYIFGGGGGGGGGGGNQFAPGYGGGGGGQGFNGGGGGSGSGTGSAGTAGDQSSYGFGGSPNGGNGGEWGQAGSAGLGGAVPGGSPGAGGAAVFTNGVAVTWLGGNNGTQVRGAVV